MTNKQTKRSRKFHAKGGVKGRLEKGSITNKGKLKKRSKKKNSDGNRTSTSTASNSGFLLKQQQEERRQEQDFVSQTKLGDLDMDSFLESFDREQNDNEERSDGSDKEEQEEASDEEKDNESVSSSDDSATSSSSNEDEQDVEEASNQMKEKMEQLSKSDPDFYEFLKEKDRSLLDFKGTGEEEEVDEVDDGDDEEPEEIEKKDADASKGNKVIHLTPEVLMSLQKGAFEAHGLKSLKRLVSAYKTACHLADEEQQEHQRYLIDSSEVFDQLMVSCLENVHDEFRFHLLKNEEDKETEEKSEETSDKDGANDVSNKPIHPKLLEKANKWSTLKPIMESFFKSTLHLLSQAKEPELLATVLKSLMHYLPCLSPFPRLANTMLTTCTNLWSAPLGETSAKYQVVSLQAFLRIRQLALTQPFPFVETCLKKVYSALAKRCKFISESTLPTLTFMGNCVVELYHLDWHSSYQHAFVYVRQLALHLRTAFQKKSLESFQAVYCWQYLQCLKVWTAVLVSSSQDDSNDAQMMHSLLYPLVEVILGVVRLIPTARYVPLRFHCVRLLQQLAAAFESFVPTTAILLDVLDLKELSLKPKKIANRSTGGVNLSLLLKLPKEAPLRTKEQLEAVVSELFLLLNREVDLYRFSAGFPEFAVRICQRLRKFSKETKNGRWRAYAKVCVEMCDRYSAFCVQERSKLNEAPKDVKILEVLKPQGAPNMYARHEAAIDKENKLLVASRPVMAPSSTGKRKASESEPEEDKVETSKKRTKKTRTPRKVNESDLKNTGALEQDDQVDEGIDWSDDE